MKNQRAREFLFEPTRFKNDPAVMGMTLAAKGAYIALFCECWDMPEPGILPSDDNLLAILARCDPQDWEEVRDEVAAAFDTKSMPGFWIQKGLRATYEQQTAWYERQSELGRQGGLKRAFKAASSKGVEGKGKVLKGRKGLKTQPTRPPEGDLVTPSSNGHDNGKPDPKSEWLEAFTADFYPGYPRKVKPDAARRAWLAVKPWNQETCDMIFAGLERWKVHWREHETEAQYIPHPASFLNSGQWKERPQ